MIHIVCQFNTENIDIIDPMEENNVVKKKNYFLDIIGFYFLDILFFLILLLDGKNPYSHIKNHMFVIFIDFNLVSKDFIEKIKNKT